MHVKISLASHQLVGMSFNNLPFWSLAYILNITKAYIHMNQKKKNDKINGLVLFDNKTVTSITLNDVSEL